MNRTKILFAALATLVLFTASDAQTLQNTKLDQFFDRLAEKNQAMGCMCRSGACLIVRMQTRYTIRSVYP